MTPRSECAAWYGEELTMDAARVLRVHRYVDVERVRPVIRRAAERSAERAAQIARPEARYCRRDILSCANGELVIQGGHRFTCPAFDRLLGDCSQVVIFVLTLGPAFDAEVADLIARSDPVDALFVESAGWLLVERATRQFGAHLRHELVPEGLAITFRVGPGYDYRFDDTRVRWDLDQQRGLFDTFGDVPLPVTLHDSCAMSPKMSRSGLFGVTRRE